jgi:ABC-type Fe3+-siderophore transport system permease subunit
MVLKYVHKYKWFLIGAAIGSIGGFLYWNFVGCQNGACAIKSDPVLMTLYGAAMGALLFDIINGFLTKKNKQDDNSRND